MAVSRYNRRSTKKNSDDMYFDYFEKRDVDFINHYSTPEFIGNDQYKISELGIKYHVWGQGDKVYKLAEKYYGDPSLWWVICKFNQKPTESHIKEGDRLLIPLNLQKAIAYMGI